MLEVIERQPSILILNTLYFLCVFYKEGKRERTDLLGKINLACNKDFLISFLSMGTFEP